MHNHTKKMIVPIVITVLFLAYLAVYGWAVKEAAGAAPVMIVLALPLIVLGIGMVYTLYMRNKEIRSGEEDDLSDY